jgi:hypothetical protein
MTSAVKGAMMVGANAGALGGGVYGWGKGYQAAQQRNAGLGGHAWSMWWRGHSYGWPAAAVGAAVGAGVGLLGSRIGSNRAVNAFRSMR